MRYSTTGAYPSLMPNQKKPTTTQTTTTIYDRNQNLANQMLGTNTNVAKPGSTTTKPKPSTTVGHIPTNTPNTTTIPGKDAVSNWTPPTSGGSGGGGSWGGGYTPAPSRPKLDPFNFQTAMSYDDWSKKNGESYKAYADEQKQMALDNAGRIVTNGRDENRSAYEGAVKNSRDDYFKQYASAMESTGGMSGGLAQQFNDSLNMSQQQAYNDLHNNYRGQENSLTQFEAQANADAQKLWDDVYRSELDKNYERYYGNLMTENANNWGKYQFDVGQNNYENEWNYKMSQDSYNRQMQQAQMQQSALQQQYANSQAEAKARQEKLEYANKLYQQDFENQMSLYNLTTQANNSKYNNWATYNMANGGKANWDDYTALYNNMYKKPGNNFNY